MQITDITVQSYSQPMGGLHRGRFQGQQEVSLVTVKTDEGVEGYATARAQGGTSGAAIGEYVVRTAKPRVLGLNPLDRELAWQRLFELEHAQYAPIFVTSAIDVALWDIAGKVMGQPIYRVLGGYRSSIPAYASSSFYGSIDEYLADARRCVAEGFRAYKIHPFRQPDRDIELCEAIRAEVGPHIKLMLDVTSSYNRIDALRVGRALERLNFYWYEEPLSHYDYEGNRGLRLALDIPIAGAETMSGSALSGGSHLAFGSFDLILCDVYWKMGVTGMIKLARACEALGVQVASHHGASPLMNWANLHCLCAIPNVDYIEVIVPAKDYDFGLKSFVGIDALGCVTVPDAPGLGVEVDWDYVDSHTTSRM